MHVIQKKLYTFALIIVALLAINCSSRNRSQKTTDEIFHERFVSNAQSLNKQCPIQVDEITTFKNVVVSGNKMMIKTVIKEDFIGQVDFDFFKLKMASNYSRLLDKEFVNYIDKNKYYIEYVIMDEHDNAIRTIEISGRDIMNSNN